MGTLNSGCGFEWSWHMLSTRTHVHTGPEVKICHIRNSRVLFLCHHRLRGSTRLPNEFRALDLLSVSHSNPFIHPPYWFSSSSSFPSMCFQHHHFPIHNGATEWISIRYRHKAATHTSSIVCCRRRRRWRRRLSFLNWKIIHRVFRRARYRIHCQSFVGSRSLTDWLSDWLNVYLSVPCVVLNLKNRVHSVPIKLKIVKKISAK